MRELKERVLEDDYPVYMGYYYVVNDKVVYAPCDGTVKMMKLLLKTDTVMNCDMMGRGIQPIGY